MNWYYDEKYIAVDKSDFRLLREAANYEDTKLTLIHGKEDAQVTKMEHVIFGPEWRADPPSRQIKYFNKANASSPEAWMGYAEYGFTYTMARHSRVWNVGANFNSGWVEIPGTRFKAHNGVMFEHGPVIRSNQPGRLFEIDHKSPLPDYLEQSRR